MKLKHAKGIHDFNRALAINSTLFQVSVWQRVSNVCIRLGEVGEAVKQRDRSKIQFKSANLKLRRVLWYCLFEQREEMNGAVVFDFPLFFSCRVSILAAL